tara:strand:+ start:1824 stop:4019 length:2196 start_codon:yes stop_codon:yes gene_type:complete
MAKTYYKPQPVAAQTQINWAEVGKDFSDMLAEDKRVKDEKRAAIDEDTRQQMKNLNSVELINGQVPSANEWWLNASGEITSAMQMANNLLKSGELNVTAYTKMMQNINDGADGLIGVFDKFKNEYNLKKERMDCNDPEGVGCSQKLEYWAMEQLESMGNFQNTAVVVNPDTGSFSVADLVEGRIVNDPNKVRSVNTLQTMAGSEYNLYDDKAATDGFVDGLGGFSQEFVIPGRGDDKTQIVSSSNRFGGSIDFNSINDNSIRTTDGILFNAIVGGESSDYSTIYAGSKIQPPSDINTMTVAEVQNWQKKNAAAGSISSAAGRFQIITSTLNGLLKNGTISKDDIFNEETQDKAYNALLERRGYSKFKDDFVNSKSDEEKIKLSQDFQVNLAQEWASIPVPYAIKKGRDGKYPKVDLVAGDSYYKSVAGNKAAGDPKQFTKMLMNLDPSGIPISAKQSSQELTAEQEVYLAAEDQFITRVMADPRHITSILTNSIGKDKDGNDYTFTNKEDREPWEILLKDGMVISTTEEQNEIVREYLRNDVRGKQDVNQTRKFVDSKNFYNKYNPKSDGKGGFVGDDDDDDDVPKTPNQDIVAKIITSTIDGYNGEKDFTDQSDNDMEKDIRDFAAQLGFEFKRPTNWWNYITLRNPATDEMIEIYDLDGLMSTTDEEVKKWMISNLTEEQAKIYLRDSYNKEEAEKKSTDEELEAKLEAEKKGKVNPPFNPKTDYKPAN